MAKIDVGELTAAEMRDLLGLLIDSMPDHEVREIICDSLDESALEELELACQEKRAELEAESEEEDE